MRRNVTAILLVLALLSWLASIPLHAFADARNQDDRWEEEPWSVPVTVPIASLDVPLTDDQRARFDTDGDGRIFVGTVNTGMYFGENAPDGDWLALLHEYLWVVSFAPSPELREIAVALPYTHASSKSSPHRQLMLNPGEGAPFSEDVLREALGDALADPPHPSYTWIPMDVIASDLLHPGTSSTYRYSTFPAFQSLALVLVGSAFCFSVCSGLVALRRRLWNTDGRCTKCLYPKPVEAAVCPECGRVFGVR